MRKLHYLLMVGLVFTVLQISTAVAIDMPSHPPGPPGGPAMHQPPCDPNLATDIEGAC